MSEETTHVFSVKGASITQTKARIQIYLDHNLVGLKSLMSELKMFDFSVGSGKPTKCFLQELQMDYLSPEVLTCTLNICASSGVFGIPLDISILMITTKGDEITAMALASPQVASSEWVDLDEFLVAPEPGILNRGPRWNLPLLGSSSDGGTINYETGEVDIPVYITSRVYGEVVR